MSEGQAIYKVGHCPCCEAQTLITDTFNRPIGFIPKTYACWLCLCDEEGNVKTRIGSFVMCEACYTKPEDPEKVFQSLIESPHSGLYQAELLEEKIYPKKKIELIRQYGI